MGTFYAEVKVGGELAAFVVASEHDYLAGAGDLHGEDEQEYFDGEVASVYVVAQEDVFGCFAVAPDVCVEEFQKIVELTMNVSDDGDGIIDEDEVGLRF
jgi:hypothetical protein